AVLFGGLTGISVPAQAQDAPRAPRKIQLTPADVAAAKEATVVFRHAHPTKSAQGSAFKRSEFAKPGQRSGPHSAPHSASAAAGQNDRERFPADLAYLGGAVLPFAQSHPIFLLPNGSCPVATCWGDPDSFLAVFADSELAHITDLYVVNHSGG